jgi:hypothetical protein
MKKKIAFLVSYPGIGGGMYVIFEHAIRINRRSHFEVVMLTENEIQHSDLFWHPEAQELEWSTVQKCKDEEFEAIISTWWLTCYDLYQLKAKAYIYFNQSVESKFYKENEILNKLYADSTYLLGLSVITEATWIKNYLKEHYGINASLVRNGIRKDIYKKDGKAVATREEGKLRVLVEGPLNVFFKNTEGTIKLVTESKADEVWLLTSSDIEEYPGVDRVFSRVPILKTPEIYRSCDVVVKLSYVEGMFGPPLEMFHCGGTAIVYNVTGHDEYIIHDRNAIVVEMNEEDKVIESINTLIDSPAVLSNLINGATQSANEWHNWDQASLCFENAVMNFIDTSTLTQMELEKRTILFKTWFIQSRRTSIIKVVNNLKNRLRNYPTLFGFIKSIYRSIRNLASK